MMLGHQLVEFLVVLVAELVPELLLEHLELEIERPEHQHLLHHKEMMVVQHFHLSQELQIMVQVVAEVLVVMGQMGILQLPDLVD
jgi:hypothetical protein